MWKWGGKERGARKGDGTQHFIVVLTEMTARSSQREGREDEE